MKDKNEKVVINDKDLENVSGGDVQSANIVGGVLSHCRPFADVKSAGMPQKQPDERYVMDAAPTADDIISELKS